MNHVTVVPSAINEVVRPEGSELFLFDLSSANRNLSRGRHVSFGRVLLDRRDVSGHKIMWCGVWCLPKRIWTEPNECSDLLGKGLGNIRHEGRSVCFKHMRMSYALLSHGHDATPTSSTTTTGKKQGQKVHAFMLHTIRKIKADTESASSKTILANILEISVVLTLV